MISRQTGACDLRSCHRPTAGHAPPNPPPPPATPTMHILHRLQQLPHQSLDSRLRQATRMALQVLQYCRGAGGQHFSALPAPAPACGCARPLHIQHPRPAHHCQALSSPADPSSPGTRSTGTDCHPGGTHPAASRCARGSAPAASVAAVAVGGWLGCATLSTHLLGPSDLCNPATSSPAAA